MKTSIRSNAKTHLGSSEYVRLVKFLVWLDNKLEIPSATNLEVVVVDDPQDHRTGSVACKSAKELTLMLNAHDCKDETILNPVTGRYEDWFATAAHEMVHVKQFSTSQLTADTSFYWESKKFHEVQGCKLSYKQYVELPWEAEAFTRQDELYQEWLAVE